MNLLFLENIHKLQGAKFGEFAAYNMPITYSDGLIQEHLHTRKEASLFDVSHMGQVHIQGKDAEHLLNVLLPIPIEKLGVGRARYTVMLNEQGGIIDDLIVTRKDDNLFWIVFNAACLKKDLAHVHAIKSGMGENKQDVEISFLVDRILCAIQGPSAESILSNILQDETIIDLKFMSGTYVKYKETEFWINRSGYTGEDGFEMSIPHSIAKELIQYILDNSNARFAGLGARNSLRLEAGLSLYGNDMNEQTNVYEADLGFAISKLRLENTNSDIDFIGADATRTAKEVPLTRKKVAILPSGKAPVREHVTLFASESSDDQQSIGEICSGGFSPTLGVPIALAYVNTEHNMLDNKIWAELRGKRIESTIVSLPFVPQNYKR